jgi:hypothetical protein
MQSEKLSVNWAYLISIAVVASVALGFIAWSLTMQVYRESANGEPITGGWTWTSVILLNAFLITVLLALFWKIYRDANTHFGEEELSQPGIFRLKRIKSSEVTRSDGVGFGFHIRAGRTKIVVTPYAYKQPHAMIALVRARLAGRHSF